MPTYNPAVFLHDTPESARDIILTHEGGQTPQERWEKETPLLCDWLLSRCNLQDSPQVLDFGCGIGRMSRALMQRTQAQLWGVDISPSMRAQALGYVGEAGLSERFSALSPQALDFALANGMRFDMALSVWVLQHCPNLNAEVQRLHAALKPGGVLFAVDMDHRAIPTVHDGWIHDGLSVEQTLRSQFTCLHHERLSHPDIAPGLSSSAWIAIFQKN
jgi:cyclopropane fatty-acyl-phospholipid synthase-like methyltransferase